MQKPGLTTGAVVGIGVVIAFVGVGVVVAFIGVGVVVAFVGVGVLVTFGVGFLVVIVVFSMSACLVKPLALSLGRISDFKLVLGAGVGSKPVMSSSVTGLLAMGDAKTVPTIGRTRRKSLVCIVVCR